jgi:hypothetical protein
LLHVIIVYCPHNFSGKAQVKRGEIKEIM